MILCFDVGNTNVVLGIVSNKVLINSYRFVTNYHQTEDEYYQKISFFTNTYNEPVTGAIIASVVPPMDHVLTQMIKKYYHINPLIVGPGLKSSLKIKIDNPKSLGADLLCDAVGAYEKYGGPTIIVDLGTATKIIVVNGQKEFMGGIIACGIQTSLASLVQDAAQLSTVPLCVPSRIIAKDTKESIQAGLIVGHAVMIDGLLKKVKEELKEENPKVVLTGGLSKIIKDLLVTEYTYDANLVIDGLISIYYKNCEVNE